LPSGNDVRDSRPDYRGNQRGASGYKSDRKNVHASRTAPAG
jgi:hypothetical protein